MCIRDRPSTTSSMCGCGCSGDCSPGSGLPSVTSHVDMIPARGAAAVSYTHLTLPTICSV
eukprot:2702843-Prorocentrum_lima.AAC.1